MHKSQGRWDNYKMWRNKVTDMIQTAKTSFYQRVIEENTRNPRQLWAHLREMCPRDATRTQCIIIASIIEEKDTSNVVITGDFKAAVITPFESELIAICENTGLVISNYEMFDRASNTYTYVSDAHNSTSWLDHFICSHSVNSMITDLYILDKCPSSDHLPVGLVISTALTTERCVNNEKHADKITPIFRWSNAKDCNIKEYGKCSAVHLDRIHISDSCTCNNYNCSNREHISDIDNLFDDICNALRVSSLETITTCKKTLCQDYIVPGWNDYVKEAHTETRYYYIVWRDMGKPKHGPVCELMRKTRLHFKYMLKQCQQREDMARADAMAKSMQAKDANLSKTYKKGIPNATNFNGANARTAISAMWKTDFESLLNNVTTYENIQNVKECVQNT